ncbi:MAG: 5'-deoxynucleotidase, partial [Oscillospiraceae bacterium]|nr:5'-deoxynucleotidase [Oscillospiraceae bacterium]
MYSYFALVSRLKNIDRWALMRNADRENVQE